MEVIKGWIGAVAGTFTERPVFPDSVCNLQIGTASLFLRLPPAFNCTDILQSWGCRTCDKACVFMHKSAAARTGLSPPRHHLPRDPNSRCPIVIPQINETNGPRLWLWGASTYSLATHTNHFPISRRPVVNSYCNERRLNVLRGPFKGSLQAGAVISWCKEDSEENELLPERLNRREAGFC